MARDQLTRDPDNAMLGGVCAGISRYYNIDVTLIRIVWLVLTVVSAGTSIILYIAAWVIMPRPDEVRSEPGSDRGGAHRPVETPGETIPARERVVESGRILLSHARQSAEEIGRIARGDRPPGNGGGSGASGSGAPQPPNAGTADPSAPAGGSSQVQSEPGTSQPFTPGDTPTSADPPVDDNPAPPPQSPV